MPPAGRDAHNDRNGSARALVVNDSASAAAAVSAGAWRLMAAGASERGNVRHENQDAFALVPVEGGGLGLVIADGMGGQSWGGEAAAAAVDAAWRSLRAAPPGDGGLREVISVANEAVAVVRRRLGGSPGTTMVVGLLGEGSLQLAHAGDSRAYLIRTGSARALTADHSITAERVRAGTLAPEAARTDPRRNFVTRALLGDPVEPDLVEVALDSADLVLLCSDGLWGSLPDPRIAELMETGEPAEMAHRLVVAALAAGSTDNVTAVVARATRDSDTPRG
jgi:serine/threonine protein phosphatase PrpC